jgi:hypothetical protein
MNRMVTKGYRKGVYDRVTKGITGGKAGFVPEAWIRCLLRQSHLPQQGNEAGIGADNVKRRIADGVDDLGVPP